MHGLASPPVPALEVDADGRATGETSGGSRGASKGYAASQK
jgi:hypothetical protein